MMSIKQEYVTYTMIAFVALVIGFIVGIWWKDYSVNTETALSTSTPRNIVSNSVVDKSISVSVIDQKAGLTVQISSVSVKDPSWVVVTEDIGGKPGRILGAQKVTATETNTTVDLLRGTVVGGTYHAIIYSDDGDNRFDFQVDAPLQGPEGIAIESVFRTS